MKLDTCFRLVPISVTLDDPKRRNSPYFEFLHNLVAPHAD